MTSVGVRCAVRDVVENLRAKAVSMCLETRMFMASPYWSMILVGLAPDAVGLDVGLITEPPVTDGRPAGASGVDQLRREALHPPEQRHMVQLRYLSRRGAPPGPGMKVSGADTHGPPAGSRQEGTEIRRTPREPGWATSNGNCASFHHPHRLVTIRQCNSALPDGEIHPCESSRRSARTTWHFR